MSQFKGVLSIFISAAVLHLSTSSSPLIITPYIEKHELQQARNLSYVNPALFLNTTSYSGFLTVDKTYNSNMFFWYFPVADKPVNETPWIIWLQGGPGASSLDGLFDEMGPFEYKDNKLKLRNTTWGKDYSMLYIDNPIGAGYSFTNSDLGYASTIDTSTTHLHTALMQFLKIFPELRDAPLYIAGESYAGHYVPKISMKILEANAKNISDSHVNLQGLIMGNPVFNRGTVKDYASIYYQWGLIDAQGLLAVKPMQDDYTKALNEHDLDNADDLRNKLLDKLMEIAFQTQMYNMLKDHLYLEDFTVFLQQSDVSDAIHVGDTKFTFSSRIVKQHLASQFFEDVVPILEKLMNNYRVLIYCGQLDLVAPCVPSAQDRRKRWHWNHRDLFLHAPRKPWWFNETVAGYIKSGGGFTEVLVRGAGHLVPLDKPAEAQQLVSYFIRDLDMPLPPNYNAADDETPDLIDPDDVSTSKTLTAMIASLVVNVILILFIVVALVYFIRWKKNNEAYFYTTTEDSISDGILTMA